MIGAARAALLSPRRIDYVVNSVTGNDGNSGRPGAPFASFTPLATLPTGRSLRVGLARGSEFRLQTLTVPQAGMFIGPYGTGAAPRIFNSTKFSSGSWTNVSGNEYKISAAGVTGPVPGGATPAIFWIDVNGVVTPIFKGTSGSLTANQWAIATNELHVNIGRAPVATDLFEVGNGSGNGILCDKSNVRITGLYIAFAGSNNITVNATAPTNNVQVDNCELAYTSADNINFNAGSGVATNNRLLSNYIHDAYNDGGGGGDGGSGHGATTGLVAYNTFRKCGKNGWNNEETGAWTVMHNTFDQCDCIFYGGASAGGPHFAIGNQFYSEKPGGNAAQPILYAQFANASTAFFYNNSLARGDGSSNMRGIRVDAGTLTSENNSVWGLGTDGSTQMSFGMLKSGGTLNSTTDAVGQCGANTSGFTPTGLVTLTVVPYTTYSAGSFNLAPKVGSQLLAAGTAIAGVTTGTPPDIGYSGAL